MFCILLCDITNLFHVRLHELVYMYTYIPVCSECIILFKKGLEDCVIEQIAKKLNYNLKEQFDDHQPRMTVWDHFSLIRLSVL